MLDIFALPGAPLEVNCYLAADRAAGEAILIDAPLQVAAEMSKKAAQWDVTVRQIICTHGHWDHTMGLPEFMQTFGVPTAVHEGDADLLIHPTFAPFSFPFELTPVTPNILLQEGTVILVGSHTFTVLHTPGHTPGGICLYDVVSNILFSGDTLFAGAHGRVDFPGSDPKLMLQSLHRLSALPGRTRVYPGHGPDTTIEREGWMAGISRL